jgi:protein O-GlcNAc transferase
MSQQRIQEGRQHHLRGDFANAISAYSEALAANPAAAEVWQMKAMAEHQSGKLDEAMASIAQALAVGGEQPPFLLLEGSVLHDQGDLAGAAERFARVAQARPEWAGGHVELGRVRMDQGRPAEALASFQAAVGADASHVRAWNNLGIALQSLERTDEALRAFNHTLSLDPRYPMAHFNLARIHLQRGDVKRAMEHAQNAVRHDPALAKAWMLVGDLHRRARQTPDALAAYASAVNADPENVDARTARAELIAEAGGYDEALREFRAIAQRHPDNLKAALSANLLLPQLYASAEDVDGIRQQYAAGLDRLHWEAGNFRFPDARVALNEARWTNFYLAYQGRNDSGLQKRYGEFQKRVLEPAMPQFFAARPRRSGGDRIRVGFLSHFFFNCTAGRYFSSWITHLDRSRFEIFVYYTNEWVADDTRAIAAASDTFRHLPGRPLDAIAARVAEDDLDILVYPELGMHPETFTLAGLRLAPVQCAGWGHPNTTGLEEMDWFISCAQMEPEDAASHYTERLALLPGLGTRYAIPRAETTGTRSDFGIPEDRTAYLIPQSLFKIHPDNDGLIAEVLQRDPRGVAVMFASNHENVTQAFAARLARSLERRGLDIHERTAFLAPSVPHPRYLRLNQLCDVMLDTLHWSGGNTSLDALAGGLPVVTLPGSLMRGRQSQAMLRAVGAEELVAADVENYVETAVRLGRDADERKSMSERILANRGALFERDEPVRALEDFLARAARGEATR